MFSNLGWPEVLVIIVAGLFILGPERLPDTIRRAGQLLRRARSYATGARDQLHDEFGLEFDELREPLEHVRSLRSMGPRKLLTEHLLDGYDPAADANKLDPRDELETRNPPGGAESGTRSGDRARAAPFDPGAT